MIATHPTHGPPRTPVTIPPAYAGALLHVLDLLAVAVEHGASDDMVNMLVIDDAWSVSDAALRDPELTIEQREQVEHWVCRIESIAFIICTGVTA